MRRAFLAAALALAATFVVPARSARAGDVLVPGAAVLDPPTLVSLGVQLLVTGDDDHDAEVTVRYRAIGEPAWRTGLPLLRVRPGWVTGRSVPEQFAGSLFDLVPATTYEIELRAVDPDGPVDATLTVESTTRGVPDDPEAPVAVPVASTSALTAALAAAQPGHVITLADGTYTGAFALYASGTATNPIVVRGASTAGTILDGNGCGSCNVLEVYGSHVHVERLTLQHANRGLRFQGAGTEGNVLRRVHVRDVKLGVGAREDQRDFYLCDNVVEGRLVWPHVFSDDGGARSNDDGVNVQGTGHVVCHNLVRGFGDGIKLGQDGARAVDVYGNEVLSAYDNGFEFDGSEGNVRAFRNRFTNTYATLSFQPVQGGPAYALRNVVVNVADEQLKLKALALSPPQEPSGILVFHNTFVSPVMALNLQTPATTRNLEIANNLFVGPSPAGVRVVDWTAPVVDFVIDHDGWFPAGRYDWNPLGDYPSFTAMQAGGILEANATLLTQPIFANGLVAPASYTVTLPGQDVTLDPASNAVDAAILLPNVNDGFTGAAPDLGALERGCPLPLFGVRPEGVDETNAPFGCGGPTVTSTTTTIPPTTTTTTLPYVAIGTRSLSLRDDPANAAKRTVTFKASTRRDAPANRIVPPARGGPGDPTLAGATLEIADTAGAGQHVTIALPANDPAVGAWSTLGSAAKPAGYRFRGARGGPVKAITVKADGITLKGGGASFPFTLASAPQGRVALRLVFGTERPWCAEAPPKPGGTFDTVLRFLGVAQSPPPAGCPPP